MDIILSVIVLAILVVGLALLEHSVKQLAARLTALEDDHRATVAELRRRLGRYFLNPQAARGDVVDIPGAEDRFVRAGGPVADHLAAHPELTGGTPFGELPRSTADWVRVPAEAAEAALIAVTVV